MFTVVDQDIFTSPSDQYLCHQCNCVTQRAAHMAKSVFGRYPYADIYTGREEHDEPGTIIVVGGDYSDEGQGERVIVNMLGQYYPGSPRFLTSPKDGYDARVEYFRSCLWEMTELLDTSKTFAFPWTIGCGAAGGDWGRYITMLKGFEEYIPGDVIIYKLPRRK